MIELTRLSVYLIHGCEFWPISIAGGVVVGYFALRTMDFPPFTAVLENVSAVQAQETA